VRLPGCAVGLTILSLALRAGFLAYPRGASGDVAAYPTSAAFAVGLPRLGGVSRAAACYSTFPFPLTLAGHWQRARCDETFPIDIRWLAASG